MCVRVRMHVRECACLAQLTVFVPQSSREWSPGPESSLRAVWVCLHIHQGTCWPNHIRMRCRCHLANPPPQQPRQTLAHPKQGPCFLTKTKTKTGEGEWKSGQEQNTLKTTTKQRETKNRTHTHTTSRTGEKEKRRKRRGEEDEANTR